MTGPHSSPNSNPETTSAPYPPAHSNSHPRCTSPHTSPYILSAEAIARTATSPHTVRHRREHAASSKPRTPAPVDTHRCRPNTRVLARPCDRGCRPKFESFSCLSSRNRRAINARPIPRATQLIRPGPQITVKCRRQPPAILNIQKNYRVRRKSLRLRALPQRPSHQSPPSASPLHPSSLRSTHARDITPQTQTPATSSVRVCPSTC